MKLTKLQRYTAYCIMLHTAEKKHYYMGLCFLIRGVLFISNSGYINDIGSLTACDMVIERYFPELAAKDRHERYGSWGKEDSDGQFWFKNWTDRIAALKQCIKETEPK